MELSLKEIIYPTESITCQCILFMLFTLFVDKRSLFSFTAVKKTKKHTGHKLDYSFRYIINETQTTI